MLQRPFCLESREGFLWSAAGELSKAWGREEGDMGLEATSLCPGRSLLGDVEPSFPLWPQCPDQRTSRGLGGETPMLHARPIPATPGACHQTPSTHPQAGRAGSQNLPQIRDFLISF